MNPQGIKPSNGIFSSEESGSGPPIRLIFFMGLGMSDVGTAHQFYFIFCSKAMSNGPPIKLMNTHLVQGSLSVF